MPSKPLTIEQRAELRKLYDQATHDWQPRNEHEWRSIIANVDGGYGDDGRGFRYTEICEMADNDEAEKNAALMIAAVNRLPNLLDQIDFLEEQLAEIHTVLTDGPGLDLTTVELAKFAKSEEERFMRLWSQAVRERHEALATVDQYRAQLAEAHKWIKDAQASKEAGIA